jgi:Tol biopolymer transport system component
MATVLLVLTLSLAWAYFTRRPAEARAMKLSILPPEKTSFGQAVVSPDGHLLAFTGATGGKLQLWVRPLDATEARLLAGTEGAVFPFWSPDSHHLGFFADGKLKKIDVSGALPATVCDVIGVGVGGSWNRDDVIIFSSLEAGLSRVSAKGGEVTPVMKPGLKRQESSYGYPYFLPDGHHFLFVTYDGPKETHGIYFGSLDGGISQRLLGDESNAAYAASGTDKGYLLFARDEELMAQLFDPEAGQLTGEPFRVAGQVGVVLGVSVNTRRRNFSVSENGVLVFDPLPNRQRNQVIWMDRGGRKTGSLEGVDDAIMVRLSSDDKRFLVVRREFQPDAVSDLWLSDITGQNVTRFTFDPRVDQWPVWSPDGLRVVWASNREGLFQLYEKSASGSGQDTLLFKSDYSKYPTDWSHDGRFIIYRQIDPKTKYDLWVLPVGSMAGDQKPFPFLQTEANEVAAVFSPDGRWAAYASDESGQYEVYVQSFPMGGGKRQISKGGGLRKPQW